MKVISTVICVILFSVVFYSCTDGSSNDDKKFYESNVNEVTSSDMGEVLSSIDDVIGYWESENSK